MSLKTLIIYKNKTLYNILNEINDVINFKVEYVDSKYLNFEESRNLIVLTSEKDSKITNKLVIDFLPIKLKKLIEKINITFLRQEYNFQSNINIGKYELDLNGRVLSTNGIYLNLTEMESNMIIFLHGSESPTNIKNLQKMVWGHMPDLETHTVETHIYRLRKKIKDKFQDNNFIQSFKNGYQIFKK